MSTREADDESPVASPRHPAVAIARSTTLISCPHLSFGVKLVVIGNCTMDEFLGKQYMMVSHEYFDEYLQFMGRYAIADLYAVRISHT